MSAHFGDISSYLFFKNSVYSVVQPVAAPNNVFLNSVIWPMYHAAVVLQTNIIDSVKGDVDIDEGSSNTDDDKKNGKHRK